jgi:hypothetical protein
VPEGRPDERDRARLEDPADEPDPGRPARGGAGPGLRPRRPPSDTSPRATTR